MANDEQDSLLGRKKKRYEGHEVYGFGEEKNDSTIESIALLGGN